MRSQFTLGVGAFGATVSSNGPDSEFLASRGQGQYVRLLAPKRRMVVRSDVQLAVGELLPIEQFGRGGEDTVRGYRQDAVLALGRDFWFSRVVVSDCAHRRQTRSFAGDAVCGFWQGLDK